LEAVRTHENPHVGHSILPVVPGIATLDEADMMTGDAQSALRRIIEDTSKQTRFVIICNYLSKIIGPLSSRCAKYRFEPISRDAQLERMRHVEQQESLRSEPGALETILDVCCGDMRIGITLLQTAAHLFDRLITRESVLSVAGCAPPEVVGKLLSTATDAKSKVADVEAEVQEVVWNGWDANQILRGLTDKVTKSSSFSDVQKAKISIRLAEAQHNLCEGANEYVTLLWVCTQIQLVAQEKGNRGQ